MDVAINLLPHQKAFIGSKSLMKVLVGGYGTGKSFALALQAVLNTIHDPGMLHLIISPSFKFARKTIIYSIYEILKKCFNFRHGVHFTFNKTEWTFYIHVWDGIISIASSNDPDSLTGANAASVGIDEAALQKKDAFDAAVERCRHPDSKNLMIYLASTPEGLNWLYELCEGKDKPEELELFRGKTQDNIYVKQTYIDRLRKNYDPILADAYLNGYFVNLTGAMAAYQFNNENIFDEEYIPDPDLPILIGFDWNWDPNVAVLCQEVPDWEENGQLKSKLIVFKEYFLENCSSEKKCKAILEDYGDQFEYVIYSDASFKNRQAHGIGESDYAIVKNAFKGYRCSIFPAAANPKRSDRLNSLNGRFCNSEGERFILIHASCENLIEDFRRCERDEFLYDNFKDPKRGHIFDSLNYLVHWKYPVRLGSVRSLNEIHY